jgi:hypothetical protein
MMKAIRLSTLLFVDANVLVQCSVGRIAAVVDDLRKRGVALATTDAQVREAMKVLEHVFGVPKAAAEAEVTAVSAVMEVHYAPAYRAREAAAKARLDYRNVKDWPLLAAALAPSAAIWTYDRDFFGVGVPVWTTRNVRYLSPAE